MSVPATYRLTIACAVCLACSPTQPRQEEAGAQARSSPAEADRLEDVMLADLVPAADGGVYAHSGMGGVWYLRGGEAVRVKEVAAFSPAVVAHPAEDGRAWLVAALSREHTRRKRAEFARDEAANQAEDQSEPEEGDRHPW